ncbi:MAG: nuclear transport factor 2 family protein [Candidatus Binatia bacterium]
MDALQSLLDRVAIHDLIMRYARGVDRRDLDLVASCFAADAAYDGALGTGGIDVVLAALRERMPRYRTTMHFLTNPLIAVDGDSASCETYALVYHRLESEDDVEDFIVGVRYVDTLARRPEGWRITSRRTAMEFQRYNAVILPLAERLEEIPSRRRASDRRRIAASPRLGIPWLVFLRRCSWRCSALFAQLGPGIPSPPLSGGPRPTDGSW